MLSKDRSPRSESKCPVERSSSCETGSNARLATKGSVQQSSVNRPEVSEHGLVFTGPGSGLMTGTRFQDPVPGIQDPVLPTTPGKPGTMTTPGALGLPVIPGDSVTPGDPVRPVFTGQEAQKEKIDKCLDRSELPVLNSPGSSVQLEHNVHKQQRNMPNLQAEHWSEYSEVFQDFTNSDSSNVKAYEFYLRSPYLIIISAICHCHPFKNELVLVLNTAWRKQPIADYVSNHNRTCGESVSENSE